MSWVRIDDHFYDHPKWATAPCDSIALWIAAMAWCNRNDSFDGFIPLAKLAGLVNVASVKRTANDLCKRHAFVAKNDGYLIHEYTEYQQNEKVRKIRESRSAAGRKGASVRWGNGGVEIANGIANPMANAMPFAIDGMAKPIANEWQTSWQTDGNEHGNENAPQPTTHNPLDYISNNNNSPSDLPSLLSDEERTTKRLTLAGTAAQILASRRSDLTSPGGWIRRTTDGLLKKRLADIDRCIDQGYSRETAMELLTTDPVKQPPPLKEAWYTDPNCEFCDAEGWVTDENGYLIECSCRRHEEYPKKPKLGAVK